VKSVRVSRLCLSFCSALLNGLVSYNCDGDHRRAGEDEGDFFEFAVTPPLLCQEGPVFVSACWPVLKVCMYALKAFLTHQPAPESPKPCAQMIVAVCFLTAGMMIGLGTAMMDLVEGRMLVCGVVSSKVELMMQCFPGTRANDDVVWSCMATSTVNALQLLEHLCILHFFLFARAFNASLTRWESQPCSLRGTGSFTLPPLTFNTSLLFGSL